MKKVLCFTFVPLLFSCMAFSQEVNRVDVFGGYSYLNVDTNNLTSRQSMNGWESGASVNFNKWAAAESDVSGYYKNNVLGTGVNASDYSFMAGPRFNYRSVFFHTLVGVDHLTGSAFGYSASQDSFAMAIGGGIQVKVAPRWAVRSSVDYAPTFHNVFGGAAFTQNNVRVGGGVVYLLSRSRYSHFEAAEKQGAVTGVRSAVTVNQLGLSGDSRSAYGFWIISITPGSPAALAKLEARDIIVDVAGKQVRTQADVESALSSGGKKITLTITRGEWPGWHTEQRELILE